MTTTAPMAAVSMATNTRSKASWLASGVDGGPIEAAGYFPYGLRTPNLTWGVVPAGAPGRSQSATDGWPVRSWASTGPRQSATTWTSPSHFRRRWRWRLRGRDRPRTGPTYLAGCSAFGHRGTSIRRSAASCQFGPSWGDRWVPWSTRAEQPYHDGHGLGLWRHHDPVRYMRQDEPGTGSRQRQATVRQLQGTVALVGRRRRRFVRRHRGPSPRPRSGRPVGAVVWTVPDGQPRPGTDCP